VAYVRMRRPCEREKVDRVRESMLVVARDEGISDEGEESAIQPNPRLHRELPGQLEDMRAAHLDVVGCTAIAFPHDRILDEIIPAVTSPISQRLGDRLASYLSSTPISQRPPRLPSSDLSLAHTPSGLSLISTVRLSLSLHQGETV
jgi:hypothetical protein